MNFSYKAKDSRNKKVSGHIEAKNKADARQKLRRSRLKSISVAEAVPDSLDDGTTKIVGNFIYKDENGAIQIKLGNPKAKSKDLIVFTKQFATMLNSGVPMIQGISILSQQQSVASFGKILKQIKYGIENGRTLSDSMSDHKIFDNLFIAMIEAGEASGNLDSILERLVEYMEKADKIKSQVKSAMAYPTVVITVAVGIFIFLLTFVVPSFGKMFRESGKELPALTKFALDMSDYVKANIVTLAAGFGTTVFALLSVRKFPKGVDITDKYFLKLPIMGPILLKIAIGRFCQTLSTMISSGVGILDALNICSTSAGNREIEKFINNVRLSISQGTTFSKPLREGGLFPTMVVSMIEVGEKSGALDEMLKKVSIFYDEEVDNAIKTLISMIEPIMIVGMGGMVGFIVIAMFLPIFDMANVAG